MDDLEEGWTAHKAPSGHTYYYNAATKKSTYQKPVRSAAVPQPPPPPPILAQDAPSDRTTQQSSAMLNSEVDQILKSQRDSNADRPKYKESIITARPWLFVTTKQGRVFYHNPETGDSFWHLPDSIADAVEAWQRAGRPEESIYDEDMQEELEFEPEEQNGDQESEGVEFDEDDIAHQLRAMEEDGMLPDEQAVENEPDFPMAERQALFQEMLLDCKVDPYSTWDAEVEKIASDPRYLGMATIVFCPMLMTVLDTTKLRKAAFDAYCIEQAQKRAAEKATIHKKPVSPCLAESSLTNRPSKPFSSLLLHRKPEFHTGKTLSANTKRQQSIASMA